MMKTKPSWLRQLSPVIALLLGVVLCWYASTLSPYKNEQIFEERYMAMSVGKSEDYWKLRDEMLTPKFQLQDYGITLIVLAVVAFAITRKGRIRLHAPHSAAILVILAFALPFISSGGYVFDLFQAFFRGEFPHWADSLGIPLASVPIQTLILLGWSLAHLGFMPRTYQPDAALLRAVSFKSNWWLLFLSVVMAILTLISIAAGQYWYAIPSGCWLYFYLSLGAVRQ
ncbi:hypothetical protein [Thiothrix sp.]|jgi:hypothetical protein|uniref:hypothetical protein n=1 Tax=Thiothrix sp. TaxID=1032 RepID=UPI00257B1334|nr:hypothetical protein [Thiothrix sp.]